MNVINVQLWISCIIELYTLLQAWRFSPFILQHKCMFRLGGVQNREHQAKVFPYVFPTFSAWRTWASWDLYCVPLTPKKQLETDLEKIHWSSLQLKCWILIWQPLGTLPGSPFPVNLLKLQKIIRVKLMCRMLGLRRRVAPGKSHKNDHLL